ncbi:calmodulin-binding protein 25 [Sorghum bicolor]|uniref:VQ domain-containing protein n=1 Tax=Sorghum bicolor TaxID=4558 RepID=A0A1B6PBP1_SORBI|nr:calmodulin-binding protein 25 [Sorghum bicolor]KXG22865.1 hypothetical protein SORBI_3008G018400 [Sorghum bicolor]|eukprot:XP_002442706.2 calmodulin-binding protein 25 [Sorghum bicolor]
MLMAAATHLAGSAHSSSSSISPQSPPPWHPVVLVPNHNQHHQALHDLDVLVTPSLSPSPATATPPPPPTTTTQRLLRPAEARRAGKQRRRPRPSRKLPTTYISADAASFRRMVHQVTGADDVVAAHQATSELLCRPAPAHSRASLATTTLLLPTLDTSAFLLGAARGGRDSGGATPGRHGSAVAVGDPGAALQACGRGGVRGGGGGSCSAGGFRIPSLESWDDADALFQQE